MSLPKRNGLIRVVYGISMAGMFVFLGSEAVSYASEPSEPVANASSNAVQSTVRAAEHTPSIQPAATKTLPVQQHTPLNIHGIRTVLMLEGDVTAQINQHWQTFADSELAQAMPQTREVYAVYNNYDSGDNSVTLTLGFTRQGAVPGSRAIIESGLYLPEADKTVLEAWQKPNISADALRYKSDYERWILDENYQPASVTAYLGLR